MKLSTYYYVALLAFLPPFALAAAIPDGALHRKDIVKRGGEVNYLANCVNNEVWSHSVYHVSHMIWYANVDNSLSGRDVRLPRPTTLLYRDANFNPPALSFPTRFLISTETGLKEVSELLTDTRIRTLNSVNYNLIGDYIAWEGKQHDIYFADSGVTVQTHIDADAQSRAFTAWAGWAQRTSDWKYFNCYKVIHPV